MAALSAYTLTPCLHCREEVRGALLRASYTVFVRHHPFKEGWEVRKCVRCGRLTAQDSRA